MFLGHGGREGGRWGATAGGAGSAKRDGVGRGWWGGESREEEEGEGFPRFSCSSPVCLWNAVPVITDKLAEVCLSSLHDGAAGVSVRRYLFNGTRSTDSAVDGKLVSLLTTYWHGKTPSSRWSTSAKMRCKTKPRMDTQIWSRIHNGYQNVSSYHILIQFELLFLIIRFKMFFKTQLHCCEYLLK